MYKELCNNESQGCLLSKDNNFKMIEVLPIKLLTNLDAPLFGSYNVCLGILTRNDFPVAKGLIVTPPSMRLHTTLKNYDFGSKELFEQTLMLIKKEVERILVPDNLLKEVGKHQTFFVEGQIVRNVKNLWILMLNIWLEDIKRKLWEKGFYIGITDNLPPLSAFFVDEVTAFARSYFEPEEDDVKIEVVMGSLHPQQLKKIDQLTVMANKKLFLPHVYDWILDDDIKIVRVSPYTPIDSIHVYHDFGHHSFSDGDKSFPEEDKYKDKKSPALKRSAVKIFSDLSEGYTLEKEVDGIFINSTSSIDIDHLKESMEQLTFRVVEASNSFDKHPVLLKLADVQDQRGGIRGALRLLHHQNLFNALVDVILFARNKKGLDNIHIVVPFVRNTEELIKLKKELAAKKLTRKSSMQIWLEIGLPENILNIEDYLNSDIDGVIINLDEMISFLNGFDFNRDDMAIFKKETSGLLKFLDTAIKTLHKNKIPFISFGTVTFYPNVLEYLVERGVYGVIAQKYEIPGLYDLLRQVEKKIVIKRG